MTFLLGHSNCAVTDKRDKGEEEGSKSGKSWTAKFAKEVGKDAKEIQDAERTRRGERKEGIR
jgi:hypothetical protein